MTGLLALLVFATILVVRNMCSLTKETEEQLAEQHEETDGGENDWTWRSQDPELAKYGPSSSGYQPSRRVPAESMIDLRLLSMSRTVEQMARLTTLKHQNERKSTKSGGSAPYEIVATVLDKNAENLSETNSSAPDLTKLLASYPKAAGSPCRFAQKDVIAFKTLMLCLETWKPLLSDWQCGQVQTADASGNSVELSDWTLAAKGGNRGLLKFAPNSEPRSVQTGKMSEAVLEWTKLLFPAAT